MIHLSRRAFMRVGLVSGAGLFSGGVLGSMLGCASTCPSGVPSPRHGRRVLADLHVHPLVNDWLARSPLAVKLPAVAKRAAAAFNKTGLTWKTCHEARIDLVCEAHFNLFDEWLSMPTDPNPEAPFRTMRMMDLLEQELAGPAAGYARLARNGRELKALLDTPRESEAYRVAVVHALEGGHALGGNLDAIAAFARRGVAMITITHFFNKGIASAANAYPFFPDAGSPRAHQGLSAFGRSVIRVMEDRGIIVDVTHATSAAMDDILKVATKPLVATHTAARTLGDHPYALLDEHLQELVRRGGLVGVVMMPYWLSNYRNVSMAEKYGTLRDVVRTIRYVAKICGTHRHIGIGSDYAGYIPAPKDLTCLGQIDRLRAMLLAEFDEDEAVVEDIMANNVIRFLLDNWQSGG